jgi:hypothetical protein
MTGGDRAETERSWSRARRQGEAPTGHDQENEHAREAAIRRQGEAPDLRCESEGVR